MHTMYLDIETLPLPIEQREFMRPTSFKLGNLKDVAKIEAKKAHDIRDFEAGVDGGLDELQTQIALIGYILNDEPYVAIELGPNTERQMLAQFWSVVNALSTDLRIVGHNIKGFDAPMMIHRSWICGLQPPMWIVNDLKKYDSLHWKDTMTMWQLGNRGADMRSLKHLCGAFGIEVKEGEINGANFREWWGKDREGCIAYNKQDVAAVKELWDRISGS